MAGSGGGGKRGPVWESLLVSAGYRWLDALNLCFYHEVEMTKVPLSLLQDWYSSNCDGDWEHQYGVAIETLDNPGWSLSIDLIYTKLEQRTFEEVKIDRSDSDWVYSRVEKKKFEAACGPHNLKETIEIFTDWANN